MKTIVVAALVCCTACSASEPQSPPSEPTSPSGAPAGSATGDPPSSPPPNGADPSGSSGPGTPSGSAIGSAIVEEDVGVVGPGCVTRSAQFVSGANGWTAHFRADTHEHRVHLVAQAGRVEGATPNVTLELRTPTQQAGWDVCAGQSAPVCFENVEHQLAEDQLADVTLVVSSKTGADVVTAVEICVFNPLE